MTTDDRPPEPPRNANFPVTATVWFIDQINPDFSGLFIGAVYHDNAYHTGVFYRRIRTDRPEDPYEYLPFKPNFMLELPPDFDNIFLLNPGRFDINTLDPAKRHEER